MSEGLVIEMAKTFGTETPSCERCDRLLAALAETEDVMISQRKKIAEQDGRIEKLEATNRSLYRRNAKARRELNQLDVEVRHGTLPEATRE